MKNGLIVFLSGFILWLIFSFLLFMDFGYMDIPAHFFGGLTLLSGMTLFKIPCNMPSPTILLFLLLLVIWEIFEAIMNIYVGYNIYKISYIGDVMSDICMGIIGGVIFLAIQYHQY